MKIGEVIKKIKKDGWYLVRIKREAIDNISTLIKRV